MYTKVKEVEFKQDYGKYACINYYNKVVASNKYKVVTKSFDMIKGCWVCVMYI